MIRLFLLTKISVIIILFLLTCTIPWKFYISQVFVSEILYPCYAAGYWFDSQNTFLEGFAGLYLV